MGSYSNLRIGRLNIDWSKNSLTDHSCLFSDEDLTETDYHYAYDVIERHPSYSRKLYMLKNRLNLMGFGDINNIINLFKESDCAITYEKFLDLVQKIDIKTSIHDEDEDERLFQIGLEEFPRKILNILKIEQEIIEASIFNLAQKIDGIHPYTFLSFFIQNDLFTDEDVVWEFSDLVEGGWIEEEDVFNDISENPPFLIITEGHSDTKIISKAFKWLYPDISGFFEFIDMKDNYPFGSAGQMANFHNGLCKIGTNRQIIFIFDNDSAGIKELSRCKNSPTNFKLLRLPDHEKFSSFVTVGPNGENHENINGSAVSIEMFLDHSFKMESNVRVRWTAYQEKEEKYQGVIEQKVLLQNNFYSAFKNRNTEYSTEMLKYLLDFIIDEAVDVSIKHNKQQDEDMHNFLYGDSE